MKRNRDILERPGLTARIKRNRHRRAGAERCQEKIVRRRPGTCSAESHRFIACETMCTDFNFLGEPSRAAADDDARRTVRNVRCHRWRRESYRSVRKIAKLIQ